MLSLRLADDHPRLAYDFFNDMVIRLQLVEDVFQKQMLAYIIPWIRKMDFNELVFSKLRHIFQVSIIVYELGPFLFVVQFNFNPNMFLWIQNFLLITLKYGDIHPTQIPMLWATLAEKVSTLFILYIISFLIDTPFFLIYVLSPLSALHLARECSCYGQTTSGNRS